MHSLAQMGYGGGEQAGIIPRLNTLIFDVIAERSEKDPGRKCFVTVSYLEIYNEVLKDLLNPSDKMLKIREHPEMGIYVDSLCELVVNNSEDVSNLIEQGSKVRQVAATEMNARSSRSHSCFTIKIEQQWSETAGDVQKDMKLHSKINLVDLAGSERADKTKAQGDRLKEGAMINKSLSALGNVINALSEGGKGHIPYRDSKLTRLLQESLGGNAVTVMLAAVSPADYNHDETLSTLQYAARAKKIKNEAKKNEDASERLIRELRDEIEELRRNLLKMNDAPGIGGRRKGGGGGGGGDFDDEDEEDEEKAEMDADRAEAMEKMEEQLANLEREKNGSWEEKERLSKLYEEERKANMANVDRVKEVMSTMKQENVELIKRLKGLQRQKIQLTRKFKDRKTAYSSLKSSLEGDMGEYTKLLEQEKEEEEKNGHVSEELDARMETMLGVIEDKRRHLLAARDSLQRTKEQLTANEEQQMEERAEMAAKKMILREDKQLRGAIQEEIEKKFEAEKASYLDSALADEKARLIAGAEEEKRKLAQRYRRQSVARVTHHEHELELKAVQDAADKDLLLLEMDTLKKRHNAALQNKEVEFENAIVTHKNEARQMFREFCTAFEEEQRKLMLQNEEMKRILKEATAVRFVRLRELGTFSLVLPFNDVANRYTSHRTIPAVLVLCLITHVRTLTRDVPRMSCLPPPCIFVHQDIIFLTERNNDLEAQLLEAAAWEPT